MADFSLVKDSKGVTLAIVFDNGEVATLSESHPNFEEARDYVIATPELDEDYLRQTVDILGTVGYNLKALSERVRISGNTLTFDNDPIDTELSQHIVRLVREGNDEGYKGLVNFLEKVQTNPSQASRDALYSWIRDRNITIHPSGDFIAYKGVRRVDGQYLSIHSGTAIVDGVTIKGQIPNPVGATVEMPRSAVNTDTKVGCSTGLHAGSYEYANNFKGYDGALLRVLINPRDVVSVPNDCEFQKLRVCRYTVLDVTDAQDTNATYTSPVVKEFTVENLLEAYEISEEDKPYVDRIVENADGDIDILDTALDVYFNTLTDVTYRSQAESAAHEVIVELREEADDDDYDDDYYADVDDDDDDDEEGF